MKGLTSELISVRTPSGFDYIASVCQNTDLEQIH